MEAPTFEFFEKIEKTTNLHLGEIILKNMKEHSEDIHQIDMDTGASETQGSVRMRTIRVAQALRARGLKVGDVIMLCGGNHPDVAIPLFASLCLGTIVQPLSKDMKYNEIKHMASIGMPKIAFCDVEVAAITEKAFAELGLESEIVIFGDNTVGNFTLFSDVVKPTGTEEDFKVTEIDPVKCIAFIVGSSGTTGMPKAVSLTYKNVCLQMKFQNLRRPQWRGNDEKFINFSPLFWFSGVTTTLHSCIFGTVRLQTAKPFNAENAINFINKYKPKAALLGPIVITHLLASPRIEECDFSCFEMVLSIGSSITKEAFDTLQKRVTNGRVLNCYGLSECSGGVAIDLVGVKNKCIGKVFPWIKLEIVDTETRKVQAVNQVGEIRLKSPFVLFAGYYNNPESTANTFDSENWLSTGDLAYQDEDGDIFIVDRIKEIIKYRNVQVAPAEIENEICKLPGVLNACVVGVDHPEDGHHPQAFVQKIEGSNITMQDITTIVKNNLSDAKQLRGGVVFVESLPSTHSGKVDRKAIKAMKQAIKVAF